MYLPIRMIPFHIKNEIGNLEAALFLGGRWGASLPCAFPPDSYISKVDVLNILVAAAYRHVPSLDQILQPAAVTRLRNQLLEAEYYQLGVEVRHRADVCPNELLPPLFLGHGECLGHDHFVSVGVMAVGWGGVGEMIDNHGIVSVFGTLRPGCKSFSLKGAVFPPGLHKDWP